MRGTIDGMDSHIVKLILTAFKKLGFELNESAIHLERPVNIEFGDLSTNAALVQFKLQDTYTTPRELAEAVADAVKKIDDTAISDVSVAGPGFVNLVLKDSYLLKQLEKKQENSSPKQEYIVEYSSPNIAKPFTIGHLRSTIIGDAVANIFEYLGYRVYRDNHVGDWGTQFGKLIYAIKTWGDEKALDVSENPVKDLVALYVKFHDEAEKDQALEDEGRAWFKKLEDGNSEARALWQKCIDWSWREFSLIYDRLHITFTENQGRGYGESFFEDRLHNIVQLLRDKKLLRESQGASIVEFPKETSLPPLMIVKKDGASLYATRDLATDAFRFQHYGPDILIINEVGAEQQLYFQQLYKIEEMLGWVKPGQRYHVKHGMYRFKDKKMSTRKGNVIWLQDVLQEAYDRVKKIAGDRIAEAEIWEVAVGALKWNDLKRKSDLNITFDWDEIVSLDGNSGPYIQYTYTRCSSILKKAGDTVFTLPADASLNTEEKALVLQLLQFEQAVLQSAKAFEPHHICTYVYELAQRLNTLYAKHRVLEAESKEKEQLRLWLVTKTQEVLKQSLALLGIRIVERM